jgi:SAM-dependent methyltransferase
MWWMDRMRLRSIFGEVPETYDRARPTYPDALFDDLLGLAPGPRLLEIGCGTGKATAALVAHGYDVTCVELGEGLAAVARRNVPQARVLIADFETWQPDGEFDAVAAFTAFHWLDPDTRYGRAASVLRPGGALAVAETHHVLGPDGDPFFAAVQEDYDAVDPRPDNRPPPRPEEIADLTAAFDASGQFEPARARRYLWDVTYTAEEYVALLDTYSGHRALPEHKRRRLYDRIRTRIGNKTVRKTYLATLTVASKKA